MQDRARLSFDMASALPAGRSCDQCQVMTVDARSQSSVDPTTPHKLSRTITQTHPIIRQVRTSVPHFSPRLGRFSRGRVFIRINHLRCTHSIASHVSHSPCRDRRCALLAWCGPRLFLLQSNKVSEGSPTLTAAMNGDVPNVNKHLSNNTTIKRNNTQHTSLSPLPHPHHPPTTQPLPPPSLRHRPLPRCRLSWLYRTRVWGVVRRCRVSTSMRRDMWSRTVWISTLIN